MSGRRIREKGRTPTTPPGKKGKGAYCRVRKIFLQRPNKDKKGKGAWIREIARKKDKKGKGARVTQILL